MRSSVLRLFLLCLIGLVALSASQASEAAPPAQPPVLPSQADGRRGDPAWGVWEGLAFEIRAKVDPRILAELRGMVLPAHLNPRLEASVGPLEPKPLTRTRFLVHLRQQPDLAMLDQMVSASQTERRTALFDLLLRSTQAAQAGVRAALDARVNAAAVAGYQPFLIVNALAVEGDLATLIELAQRPDVERITANYPLVVWNDGMRNTEFGMRSAEFPPRSSLLAGASWARPSYSVQAATTQQSSLNWNIDLVGASRVWRELGVRGEGAVVAGFDTGVAFQHPALLDQYRGNLGNRRFDHNYNWFEPNTTLYPDGNLGQSHSNQPIDCDGHGTHTMGTMVGDGRSSGAQIGMAPGARWIALPGICGGTMPGGIRDDIGALKAFQWLLCPTDLSGQLSTADCSKAPDVVNNSWGSANPVNDVLRPAVQRLRAAGIAPVFAAGNPSAGPGSIGTPANAPEAITVGATTHLDTVATFSGRGPSFYAGEQKPELSAPGVDVLSSVSTSSYVLASGTSMAAPHVAGLIALLVSADLRDGIRDFSVDELERFMAYTALDLGDPGPDDDYGYGRIRAYEAVQWALSAGDLQGAVRDAVTNLPVRDAQMTGVDFGGYQFTTQTNSSGLYSTTVPAGGYDVTVAAWGYVSATFSHQQVFANSLAVADFKLQPQPTALLSGVVRSGDAPVSDALVSIAGHAATQTRTDGAGRYTLTLPLGVHMLVVKAKGFRVLQTPVMVEAGGAAADFSLQAAPSILLVEADGYNGWFFSWPLANLYRWALDQEKYQYDEWRVQYTYTETRPLDDGSIGYGIPTTTTLQAYDLVIWAHNGCSYYFSCYYSETDRYLGEYLDGGGRLIISGQDVGRMDESTLYDDYLHADQVKENGGSTGDRIAGVGFLQGLQVTLTNASLYGYPNGAIGFSPDAVAPEPGDGAAWPLMVYDNLGGGAAALAVDPCDAAYRAVYLAMGYENIGPRADNRNPAIAAMLGRSIDWVMAPKTANGLMMIATPTASTAAPGRRVEYDLRLVNASTEPETIQVTPTGNQWLTRVLSDSVAITGTVQLPPCGAADLTVEVVIPVTALNNTNDPVSVTAAYVDRPESAQVANFVTTAFAEWQSEQPMTMPRYRLGAVTLPGDVHIYAIGGWLYSNFTYLPFASAANERYNACTQQWEPAAAMPISTANAGVGAVDGKIYVVGGQDLDVFSLNFIVYDTVYAYDPASNSWAQAARLPKALAGMAVASANGKLYLFGGEESSGFFSDQTLEYDPAANTWRTRAPMPGGGRLYAGAATLNGKIYVVGGWPNLATLEVYDPATDTWATATPLTKGRHSPGVAAAPDGFLYVSGGGVQGEGEGSVERYQPQTGLWQTISSLKDGERWGATAAYAAGRVFTLGGAGAKSTESLQVANSLCLSQKTTLNAALTPATPITYTVNLVPDAVDLADAQLVDRIPTELRFTGFVANPIGATYNAAQHQVEWRGALPANSPRQQISYGVDLASTEWFSGDVISSTVIFSTSTGIVFSRTLTNTLFNADFSASAFFANRTPVRSGETLTYTISLRGRTVAGGPLAVRNPLPPELEYAPDSLTYSLGAGRYDPATRTILWEGVLPSARYFGSGEFNYVWGDSDGKGVLEDVRLDWQEISESGTQLPGFIDTYTCNLPIGFDFSFYNQQYATFCVSTNGFISFDSLGSYDYTNDCPLPSQLGNEALIAVVWDDLVTLGGVTYQSFGNAPDRYLVVQWSDVRRFGYPTTDYADFQVILHENGEITAQILDAGELNGGGSTTGLENQSGVVGVTYACDRARSLHDRLAVRFAPNTGGQNSAEIRYRAVSAADLAINQAVTNTAVISTPQGLLERQAGVLFNSVNLHSSRVVTSRNEINPTESLTYTFLLQNTGLLAAFPTLMMRMPPAAAYVEGSLACASGLCQYGDERVQWYGEIAPSQTVTVSFALRLATPLPDRTPVTGLIELDDGYGNRYEVPITFLARRANLSESFAQLTPPFVDPGESALMTLFVRNSGTLPTIAQLRMALPPGLSYEEGSLACTTGDCRHDAEGVYWRGSVPGRSVVQVQLRVRSSLTTRYGERMRGIMTVDDLDWDEHYTASTDLWVAYGVYLPRIGLPPAPERLYLPFAPRADEPITPTIPLVDAAYQVNE